MSDFVYSKNRIEKGKLTEEIQRIYHDDKPMVKEYHGDWGSLAVSHNHYNGFRPFETQEYIFVVIGGPILCFQNNRFLKNKDSSKGSEILFNRWISDKISWDTDLSGPFAIIIINKKTSELHIVTDLMSFIPVYIYQNHFNTILSTHVDVLANISNQRDEIDVISCADFIYME